jgi:hypothetical protein
MEAATDRAPAEPVVLTRPGSPRSAALRTVSAAIRDAVDTE